MRFTGVESLMTPAEALSLCCLRWVKHSLTCTKVAALAAQGWVQDAMLPIQMGSTFGALATHGSARNAELQHTLDKCTSRSGHAKLNRLGIGTKSAFLACCTVGCRSHMAPGFTEFPFPKHLFHKFIQENNGGSLGSWRGPHPHQLPDCALRHTVALAGVPSCPLVPEA